MNNNCEINVNSLPLNTICVPRNSDMNKIGYKFSTIVHLNGKTKKVLYEVINSSVQNEGKYVALTCKPIEIFKNEDETNHG